MKITVKVSSRSGQAPASVVRKRLENVRSKAKVEEVFPGLRTGRRAGLVTVNVSDDESKGVLEELRSAAEIEYAEPAVPRAAKKKARRY